MFGNYWILLLKVMPREFEQGETKKISDKNNPKGEIELRGTQNERKLQY